MKRNVIRVKLYTDNHTATKPNTFLEINKSNVKKLIVGMNCGIENGTSYKNYYFTFMMKDDNWYDVDINEAYKFMDLIHKYHIKADYEKFKEASYVKPFKIKEKEENER